MGEYSTICALSGLPISSDDRVKKILLRSAKPDNLYWVPEHRKGWKPLLLPITGYYRNCMGSIEDVEEGPALEVLYRYFKSPNVFCVNLKDHGYHPEYAFGNREFRNVIIRSLLREAQSKPEVVQFLESQIQFIESFPFTWKEGNWDDFCIQLIEQEPIYQNGRRRSGAEYNQHSYCLVLDEAFQYAISIMEPYREHYTNLFHSTLNNFLCPIYPYFGVSRMEEMEGVRSSEEYFTKGGKNIFEEENKHEYLELHARVISDSSDQFMYCLKEAVEQAETAYVAAAQTKDQGLIKEMVDMILLSCFTGRCEGIQHVWHPLRTYSIYEQNLQEVFIPWNTFKMELAERRYQTWLEEYGPEEE